MLTDQERKHLVGTIAAEYGIRIDINDPSIAIIDMCSRVLDQRIARLTSNEASYGATGHALAQAVTSAYASHVLPKLEKIIRSEMSKATAHRAWNWKHAFFAGVGGILVGAGFAMLVGVGG